MHHCFGGTLLLGSVCLAFLACQLGCVDTRVSQRLWHQRMAWAGAYVCDGSKRSDTRFSANQLLIMAGKPDHEISVAQFVDRARGDHYAPENLRTHLREALARCITIPQADDGTRVLTNKDGNALTLDQCRLWVYEENRRFPSPLPSCAGVADYYYCYVFFVRGTVFGMTQFSRWQPLETQRPIPFQSAGFPEAPG
jgi:hypothetical protein